MNAPIYSGPNKSKVISIDVGEANPKQAEFYSSEALYTCYGGAKGGGKTHALRTKAVWGCLQHAGIKMLIIRRQYSDLLENHIEPIKKLIPQEVAEYNTTTHIMYFYNGSTIKFGHYNYDSAADSYNGQEYDWIFMDEATQFTYEQFRLLGGCLRGTNDIPKHFYLTCNPGGVGHKWVKRLFIDRDFITRSETPEENENPEDYKFIFASVEDNKQLMESSPAYLQMLSSLPEKVRRAYRYGDWNALSGAYFDEFTVGKHVVRPFVIPKNWRRYRAFDYGLDCFACYWVAVDFEGHCYVYREFRKSGLIVPEAAREIHNNTLPNERIDTTFAPPDMWSTQKSDGKTMAESFMQNGVPIVKVNNSRIQGHMQIKEMLADMPDGKPQLMIFENCRHLIDNLAAIRADENNPNDCAKEPHDVTHTCVTGDTLIATPNGNVPIADLVGTQGTCYAWDGARVVEAEFTAAIMTSPCADVYEIELDTGEKIKATAEHPVLTAAGWTAVKDLTVHDDIVCVAPFLQVRGNVK